MRWFRCISRYAVIVCILLFPTTLCADVPPDPGFKRVSLKLVLTTGEDDLGDYRFFIKSGADLEEIVLRKGEQLTIEPLGGGAWYRAGKLIAVKKTSLAGLNETPSDGKLSELQKTVYDGKAAGAVELIDHLFVREVREAESSGWADPVYNIEKDAEKGLKAVLVSGGERQDKAGGANGGGLYSREPKSGLFWGTVIGGSLMTLAFISLGVWLMRRARGKAMK